MQTPRSAAPPSGADAQTATMLRQANFALVAFLLAYILSFADRQILGLMVDPIRRDLGLSDLQMGLLQGVAFALLYSTLGVPFGMAVDRWSRRNLIIGGVIVWSVATALCGLAGSFATLFAARVMVGVGEATLSPAVHSFLSDAFPPHRLARAMSIYTLGITIGSGMALIIGGSVVALIAQSGVTVLPLLGEMRPWQMTFLVVAAPGVFVALLIAMVREPRRTSHASDTHHTAPGISAILSTFWANRHALAPIHLSSACLAIYGYGITGWYPTLLIRSHDMTAGEAGLWLGLIYLVFGSLGSIAGGRMSERLALSGRWDANLRVVMLVAASVAIPATLAPLMPTGALLLMVFAPTCFLFHGYFGCATAAIQLSSPATMRGANSALFLLTNALVGLSAGMLAVPLADRWIFGETGELGNALAMIAATGCLGAFIAAKSGLKAYGLIVEQLARR